MSSQTPAPATPSLADIAHRWWTDWRNLVGRLNLWDQQILQVLTTQTNPIVIAGSGTSTQTIEIPADCFVAVESFRFWSSAESYPETSDFRCAIFYGNRDWGLMIQGQVRGELIFGTAQRPGYWSRRPWVVSAPSNGGRGILQIDFTNLSTTTTTVEIGLFGYRTKAL